MTLRKVEGFEGMRNVAQFARIYATATGTINTENGQRDANSGISSNNLLLRTRDLLDGAADENVWVLGVAIRVDVNAFTSGQTTHPYVSFRNSSGEQLRFDLIPSIESKPGGAYFKIRAMRGATTLATSNEKFTGDINDRHWIYFEFKATIRTGTNGSFSVRYHTRRSKNVAVTWDAANTGINTANQGADGADRYEISLTNNSSPTVTLALDNIYCLDGAGSVNNDQKGEPEIEAIDVSGDGATVQWDLNGGAVSLEDAWNETATTQSVGEDDSRVTTKVVGEIELAALANTTLIRNVSVWGIETRLLARMEASGTRDIQFFYRKTTGSPAQVGTRIATLSSTTITGEADVRETDPNTSAAWVIADIDGLQIGVELDA